VKERLTGAIILVALMVLLVPELLTGPVRSSTSPPPAATSSEEPPLRSYTIDLADDARARSATSSTEPTAPVPSGQAHSAPSSSPPAITEGNPASGSTDVAGTQSSSSSGAPADAARTPNPASESTETPTPTPSTTHSPTPSPAETHSPTPERHAPRLAAAKPPTHPPPPVTKPAPEPVAGGDGKTSGAWMVQLGVFASRDNADRLAQDLKGKGFKISVSETAGSGRKLFRVRAGPVSDRTAASDLAAKLRAAGVSGSVVPRS
jgi:DedD protein